MRNALGQKFFNRPALKVAEDLLGKYLCRGQLGGETAKCYLITETEAYVGPEDKASHASRGRTKRNAPMFGEAGRWYVYFTYGMHWMLNIVTGKKDYPAAVLIRGVSDFSPQHFARHGYFFAKKFLVLAPSRSQGLAKHLSKNRLNGPAKLTKFLKINKRFNAKIANKKNKLWIEDRGIKITKSQITATPRIGVDYAKERAKKPYRFLFRRPVKSGT